MKTLNFLTIIAVTATLLIATSCKKTDNFPSALDNINDITGSYEGTYTDSGTFKGTSPAVADVIYLGGIELEIHCYGDLLDTTFIMDIYADNDEIMMCATGDEFENTYGHMKGDYHMNHHGSNSTEWSHHMEDDHNSGDQHYGGFNMTDHSLNYTFLIGGNSSETIRFDGIRKKLN